MPKKKKPPRTLRRPELTTALILRWADAHHERVGEWPTADSGPVHDNRNERWARIDSALRVGLRGLPGGSSLARLLAKERGVRNRKALPPLTEDTIAAWAEAHHRRTGRWPTEDAGRVHGAAGEVWNNVAAALAQGLRTLPGGDTLARLLERRLGVPNLAGRPPLTEDQILQWADAFNARAGGWPRADAATPQEPPAPGETWVGVNDALRAGLRGLPGGSTLAALFEKHRGVRNRQRPPRLTVAQVRAWAEAHRERTGRWPGNTAGPVVDAPGETWAAVGLALRRGTRGLPGGLSLAKLQADGGGR
jgi:hypothetical protein